MKAHVVARLSLLALTCVSAGPAFTQNYPTKLIRIITSPAGGGNDFPARLIARA